MQLTTDKQKRKEQPISRGVLNYFGNAIAEVAYVSFIGNQQHNPGETMHWARHKSTDHADCIARHLIEHGTMDDDGLRHSAKLAWRALALLQLEIERDQGNGCVAENPAKDFPQTSGEFPGVEQETGHVVGGCDQCRTEETVAAINGSGNHEVTGDYEYDRAREISEQVPTTLTKLLAILQTLSVPVEVAAQIIGGTSWDENVLSPRGYIYIAGPMRGYEKFNFRSFDAARDAFHALGYVVTSPADIDRAAGDTAITDNATASLQANQNKFAYRDFATLLMLAHTGKGHIAMLRGWEHSTGATAEFFLARWLGLSVLDAETGRPLRRYMASALENNIKSFLEGGK